MGIDTTVSLVQSPHHDYARDTYLRSTVLFKAVLTSF